MYLLDLAATVTASREFGDTAVTFEERLDNGSDGGRRDVEVTGHFGWGLPMLDNQIDNPLTGIVVDFVVLSNRWHGVKRVEGKWRREKRRGCFSEGCIVELEVESAFYDNP